MQTQAFPRYKKRVPCRFDLDATKHRGFVLNLSQGGLFVSSRVDAKVGARVQLHLSPTGDGNSIPVSARVVWNRKRHTGMARLSDPGIGLEILDSDDAYLRLVDEVSNSPAAERISARGARARPDRPAAGPEAEPAPTGTRFVEVLAADEVAARAGALDEVGEGWEVLEVRE
jgi:Tfp pilus assembly protein PilZ